MIQGVLLSGAFKAGYKHAKERLQSSHNEIQKTESD